MSTRHETLYPITVTIGSDDIEVMLVIEFEFTPGEAPYFDPNHGGDPGCPPVVDIDKVSVKSPEDFGVLPSGIIKAVHASEDVYTHCVNEAGDL